LDQNYRIIISLTGPSALTGAYLHLFTHVRTCLGHLLFVHVHLLSFVLLSLTESPCLSIPARAHLHLHHLLSFVTVCIHLCSPQLAFPLRTQLTLSICVHSHVCTFISTCLYSFSLICICTGAFIVHIHFHLCVCSHLYRLIDSCS